MSNCHLVYPVLIERLKYYTEDSHVFNIYKNLTNYGFKKINQV